MLELGHVHLDLAGQLFVLEAQLGFVALGAALCLGHAGVQQDLGVGRELGLGLELLQALHQLLDDRHDALEGGVCVHLDVLGRQREQLVHGLGVLLQVVVRQLLAHGLLDVARHAAQVPEHDVLLDVLDRFGQVRWRDDGVATEDRALGEVQVGLDVAEVVLLWVGVGSLANGHGHVLVGGVHLDRRGHVDHDFVDAGHLDLFQEALDHHLLVEHLRVVLHDGHDRLSLGHPLRFAEDVGVGHGNHVGHAGKVLALDLQILHDLAALHVVQIPAVDSAQNLEHAALRLVQTGMNGAENGCALLNQRLSGADWGVAVDIGDLFLGGGHHALGGIGQPAQKLEKYL